MITVSTQLDQQVNWRTSGWMRGSWIQTAVLGRPRGCASARMICKCQCAYEPGECDVYAALVTLCLCEPKRCGGRGWLSQYLVSCDWGCCWRQHLVCDCLLTDHVRVLWVYVPMSVSLGYVLSFSTGWTWKEKKGKGAAASLSLSRGVKSLGLEEKAVPSIS